MDQQNEGQENKMNNNASSSTPNSGAKKGGKGWLWVLVVVIVLVLIFVLGGRDGDNAELPETDEVMEEEAMEDENTPVDASADAMMETEADVTTEQ